MNFYDIYWQNRRGHWKLLCTVNGPEAEELMGSRWFGARWCAKIF